MASGIILFFAWNNFRFPVADFLKEVLLKSLTVLAIVLGISLIPFYMMDIGWVRLLLVLTASILSFPLIAWFWGLNNTERGIFRRMVLPVVQKYLHIKQNIE